MKRLKKLLDDATKDKNTSESKDVDEVNEKGFRSVKLLRNFSDSDEEFQLRKSFKDNPTYNGFTSLVSEYITFPWFDNPTHLDRSLNDNLSNEALSTIDKVSKDFVRESDYGQNIEEASINIFWEEIDYLIDCLPGAENIIELKAHSVADEIYNDEISDLARIIFPKSYVHWLKSDLYDTINACFDEIYTSGDAKLCSKINRIQGLKAKLSYGDDFAEFSSAPSFNTRNTIFEMSYPICLEREIFTKDADVKQILSLVVEETNKDFVNEIVDAVFIQGDAYSSGTKTKPLCWDYVDKVKGYEILSTNNKVYIKGYDKIVGFEEIQPEIEILKYDVTGSRSFDKGFVEAEVEMKIPPSVTVET